jgi:hypothetical protein
LVPASLYPTAMGGGRFVVFGGDGTGGGFIPARIMTMTDGNAPDNTGTLPSGGAVSVNSTPINDDDSVMP